MLLLNILILLLAIPVGYLIAYLCKDELVSYKKYFRILLIAGVLLGIWFFLTKDIPASLTMFFLAVIALISLVKSDDN